MAREYQRKKNNPFLLPHAIYMQALYGIRDYSRLKEEYKTILYTSPLSVSGSVSRGKAGRNPTEEKAIKLESISSKIDEIETAIKQLPEFFQVPVMNNILYGYRYPTGADERTFRRYKQKLIYIYAKIRKLI